MVTARAKKMASCDFVAVAGMGDSAREGFSCVFGVVGEFRGYLCPSIIGVAGGGSGAFAIGTSQRGNFRLTVKFS